GGSGRNGGIVGETIDHSHSLSVIHFGFEEAKRLVSIGRKNLEEMAAFLSTNQIQADFEHTGRLHVALSSAQVEDIQRNMEVEEKLGVSGTRFLNTEAAHEEIHSPLYLGAAHVNRGGILNPVKLVHGLKRIALQRGVRLFERSPVESFKN